MEDTKIETAYNCGQLPYFNFERKNTKKMCFTMEKTNMLTAYNCRQPPYVNFKKQNAKKHAFCNGKPEY